jgi:toxin HigB-1
VNDTILLNDGRASLESHGRRSPRSRRDQRGLHPGARQVSGGTKGGRAEISPEGLAVPTHKQYVYGATMIQTWANDETERFYKTGKSRGFAKDIQKQATMRLQQLHAATSLDDLRLPPSNKLHPLGGDRKGRHAIWINAQWRLCFRFADGHAYEVEIVDYH